ncbi:MAG: PAS domain-containing protein [Campylobacterota bacterium]
MRRPEPIDEEYTFDHTIIVSETDTKGKITYANRKLAIISGYDKKELIGKPHNVLRHPDMPKEVFHDMWTTIKAGKEWSGLVKNLRKDGRYYWVHQFIKPIFDKESNITGFIAARKIPPRVDVEKAEEVYKKMKEKEK